MAASKENANKAIVKSLTGELFEVDVSRDAGANAAQQYLYKQYSNAFSPSDTFEMQFMDNEGKKADMLKPGEMYSVFIIPTYHVKLVSCTPLNNERKEDGHIYLFEIDREKGLTILDMNHQNEINASGRVIRGKKYTRAEIEAYYKDDTKPNFQLRVIYEPRISPNYQVMGDKNVRPYADVRRGLSDQEYFEQIFYGVYPRDDVQRDITNIKYQLKPNTVRELLELLQDYRHTCPSMNRPSLNGGKRRKCNTKCRSKRRSKRTRKHRQIK